MIDYRQILMDSYKRYEWEASLTSLDLTKRKDGTYVPNESNMMAIITHYYEYKGMIFINIKGSRTSDFSAIPKDKLAEVMAVDFSNWVEAIGVASRVGGEIVTATPFWLPFLQAKCNMPAARMSILQNAIYILSKQGEVK